MITLMLFFAFVLVCILAYSTFHFYKKALDFEAKYKSVVGFADDAAKKILQLETIKSELSAKVIEMEQVK